MSYVKSNDAKWQDRAALANMMIDWGLLVEDIINLIKAEKIVVDSTDSDQSDGGEKENNIEEHFDLQKILDQNYLAIKKAEAIEHGGLQAIKQNLLREVNNKLALTLDLRLSGAITWAACIVCWYIL